MWRRVTRVCVEANNETVKTAASNKRSHEKKKRANSEKCNYNPIFIMTIVYRSIGFMGNCFVLWFKWNDSTKALNITVFIVDFKICEGFINKFSKNTLIIFFLWKYTLFSWKIANRAQFKLVFVKFMLNLLLLDSL